MVENKTQSLLSDCTQTEPELQWIFHDHIWEIKSVHYGNLNKTIVK